MEDSAKGFSDFGGSIEKGETAFNAAVREGSEELTGFLGTSSELKRKLQKTGVYKIKYTFENKNTYIIHIFPMSYDLEFVEHFNNNHAFLWNRMDNKMLNDSKLFETIKVDWFCEDDLNKRMSEYRPFYRDIVSVIISHRLQIRKFMEKRASSSSYKTRNARVRNTNGKTRSKSSFVNNAGGETVSISGGQ